MGQELVKETWSGIINKAVIGAGKNSVTAGGQNTLPFLSEEGVIPCKPITAYEIWDSEPSDWPEALTSAYGKVLKEPVAWAKRCVDKYKAKVLLIRLAAAHPDAQNKSAEEEVRIVEDIAKSVDTPLIILGCGDAEKDNTVLSACSQALKGKNCLIGDATQDNYKTLTAACIADGHSIIAESPIDINIAKQLNILISDMGLPLERIVINPTIGALGYGLEYAYSIMERARLAALSGDRMMALPFICFVGQETWRVKEAKVSEKEFPDWGPVAERGIIWEVITACSLLQAGADILVMRHPKAVEVVDKHIDELMRG